jgi:hypothetical protein
MAGAPSRRPRLGEGARDCLAEIVGGLVAHVVAGRQCAVTERFINDLGYFLRYLLPCPQGREGGRLE